MSKLFVPRKNSEGEDNGQVTIIGGSSLFHGPPIFALKVASRVVDMVFLATPEPSVGQVAQQLKSQLSSFIWVPWEDIGAYIKKSDAVLIGPGLMRFSSEKTPVGERSRLDDKDGQKSRELTKKLLSKFPDKRWVIDAGSLQVMDVDWIPKGAIVTPNKKEYQMLFGNLAVEEAAKKYQCTIVLKGPVDKVCSPKQCVEIRDGNAGMTKGGTGDVLAGLTTALYAKNEAFLAATTAAQVTKKAADELFEKVGTNYNADDLADQIPQTLYKFTS